MGTYRLIFAAHHLTRRQIKRDKMNRLINVTTALHLPATRYRQVF